MKTISKVSKISIKNGKIQCRRKRVRITNRKYQEKKDFRNAILFVLMFVLMAYLCFSHSDIENINQEANASQQASNELIQEAKAEVKEEVKEITREVTAYNAGDPYQNDMTPCIGAFGDNICHLVATGQGVCATNEFDKGTVLELEGLGRCIVLDRMNSRFKDRIDWAMEAHQKTQAVAFGKKVLKIKVISE